MAQTKRYETVQVGQSVRLRLTKSAADAKAKALEPPVVEELTVESKPKTTKKSSDG